MRWMRTVGMVSWCQYRLEFSGIPVLWCRSRLVELDRYVGFSVGFSATVSARRQTAGIQAGEGWLFLAGVTDIGSRRLLGYSMDSRMRTELVSRALTMAIDARGGDVTDMIFHYDQEYEDLTNHLNELSESAD